MEDVAKLDELSLQIIALLQDDGRISIREMGKILGVSPTTVSARYSQLLEEGVIQIVAAPNPRRLGLGFHALISARLSPGHLKQAVAVLEGKPEVAWIGLTLGENSVLFEVLARNAQAFGAYKEALFAELPGFVGADVQVIWDVPKFRYAMVPVEAGPRRTGDDPGD